MKRLAALILLVLGVFALCSCGDKEAITSDKFISYFEEKGFEIEDMIDDFDNQFSEYYVAYNESYSVEFAVFKNEADAKATVEGMASQYSTKSLSTEVTSGNYKAVAFDSDGYHVMITSVDNTLLYCKCLSEYKGEVEKHFEQLGYK